MCVGVIRLQISVTNNLCSAEQHLTNIGSTIQMLHATISCRQFDACVLALLVIVVIMIVIVSYTFNYSVLCVIVMFCIIIKTFLHYCVHHFAFEAACWGVLASPVCRNVNDSVFLFHVHRWSE